MNLPRFDSSSILTIGDAMLDRYWHGATERISAEAPIPVVDVNRVEERLGGAANVALNIAALGGKAGLLGAVGEDESARILRSKLSSAGIEDVLVTQPGYQTITKLRIISRKQQLVRADFEDLVDFPATDFLAAYDKVLADYEVVILSDYDKGVLAEPEAFIARARAANKTVLVDPKFKDFSAYQGATLIKPNQHEFERAVGSWSSEREMVEKCQTMMSNLGFEAMLVTRGADGMTLVRKGQQEMHLPAHSREVFDVSGAGDTVIAVLSAALGSGQTMQDAVNLANLAAGIVVARMGTASVSGPELRIAVSNELGLRKGVMSRDQLAVAVAEAKAQGETIVFTNGCFDILHAGHVDYLQEAKQQGDKLIVAINDDAGVHRLKGEGRPINSLDRRQTMLAGLSAVDWVTDFAEDTPESLLTRLEPDVLVKGGDYSIDEVVGADIVKAYGGKVKVLKLVDGLSTTVIAEKIKKL